MDSQASGLGPVRPPLSSPNKKEATKNDASSLRHLLGSTYVAMALAGCNSDNAPTTGDHHAPVLVSYAPSTPPLADHLLGKPEQRAHWLGQQQLPSICRPKSDGDSPAGGHAGLTVDWDSVRRTCKEGLKNPMNIALLLWLLCVGVSGGMLVLLLLGLLDGAFPTPAARNRWIEINNQLLNALFTLMSVYQHPALCHHLFLLCRWRPRDAAELRATYCKQKGATGPRERAHMAVVVALLHLTVACQYVLCGLYWGYTRSTRPELLGDGLFALGVVAPVAAALYTACSPLGRVDQHELFLTSDAMAEGPAPTVGHDVVVVEPEWAGGMFDCGGGGDQTTWWLSLSCTFCVFGWNAERLGFGNRYVHAATFALLCLAPVWVLGVSALHIHDEYVIGDAVGGAGVLLCACGLLYGGYWRVQMRRRFGLPGTTACCGSKSLTDYARWLFCWPCALAQEVRTASLYHVDGDAFFYREAAVVDDHDNRQPLLKCSYHDVPCARDTMVAVPPNDQHLVVVRDEAMVPPARVVVVQVQEDEDDDKSAECSVVPHGGMTINPISVTVTEDEDVEVADHRILSEGKQRVKKLINMVTLLSLLILIYTRGFIR